MISVASVWEKICELNIECCISSCVGFLRICCQRKISLRVEMKSKSKATTFFSLRFDNPFRLIKFSLPRSCSPHSIRFFYSLSFDFCFTKVSPARRRNDTKQKSIEFFSIVKIISVVNNLPTWEWELMKKKIRKIEIIKKRFQVDSKKDYIGILYSI